MEILPLVNLPIQPHPLIGRQIELNAITQMLQSPDTKLVTLTGVGGVGKTRLSLEIATCLQSEYQDGICFVELDQINDPSLVPIVISGVLSIKISGSQTIEESLISHLQERCCLLILDNFEHLVSASSIVSMLLAACPKIKIVVTSREPLHLRGEKEYPVYPLAKPDMHNLPPLEGLVNLAPVRLFIQRAQAVRPDFPVDASSVQAVAEICAILDGLPLAIELVAPSVRLFSPQALLGRLKAQPHMHLFTVGARDLPVRQQTLQNAMEWSFRLLSLDEQTLFRRLCVFANEFSLDAVEAVCLDAAKTAESALELIFSLTEKSLIRPIRSSSESPRFSIIFLLRQFGLKLLEEAGEFAQYSDAHARFFAGLLDEIQDLAPSDMSEGTLGELETEQENLRAALNWSIHSNNLDLGLNLVNGLDLYWYLKGRYREASYWEEAIVSRSQDIKNRHRVKALSNLAFHLISINSTQFSRQIQTYLNEARDLSRQCGSPETTCRITSYLAIFEAEQGRKQQAIKLLSQCIDHARQHGLMYFQSITGGNLAWLLTLEGCLDEANRVAEESLDLAREIKNPYAIRQNLGNLGLIAIKQDRIGHALSYLQESLQTEFSGSIEVLDILYLLANVAASLDRKTLAAELCGSAFHIRETTETVEGLDSKNYQEIAETIRQDTPEEIWNDYFLAGRQLPEELYRSRAAQIITDLKELHSSIEKQKAANSVEPLPANLTRREAEILKLLSQGLSDTLIAEKLFISPRTVNAHLTSVYGKLGVNSRSAATRFAIEHLLT